MGEYKGVVDFLEYVTGYEKYSNMYMEAKDKLDNNDEEAKAYTDKFAKVMGEIGKEYDSLGSDDIMKLIGESNGDITKYKYHDDLETIIDFMKKTISGNADLKNLVTVYDFMKNNISVYQSGYKDSVKLVKIEYEGCVSLIIAATTLINATNIEMGLKDDVITAIKKEVPSKSHGMILDTLEGFAAKMKRPQHVDYLKALIDVKTKSVVRESVFSEGIVGDVISDIGTIFSAVSSIASDGYYVIKNSWTSIKATLFGILPLIQSTLYLGFQKKAKTIASLEEQAEFIRMNIEQVSADKSKSETEKNIIIKRQQAYITAYNKRAEKLRAQLSTVEKDAEKKIQSKALPPEPKIIPAPAPTKQAPQQQREEAPAQREQPHSPPPASKPSPSPSSRPAQQDDDDEFILD